MTENQKKFLDESVLVFDIDGTLCKYDFPLFNAKCFDKSTWLSLNMSLNPYVSAIPTSLFNEIIDSHNQDELYVLGVSLSSFESRNKIKFLNNYYSKFKDENIMFVSSNSFKYAILCELHNILEVSGVHKRIVLVEDNPDIMVHIESQNNESVRCVLVSDYI